MFTNSGQKGNAPFPVHRHEAFGLSEELEEVGLDLVLLRERILVAEVENRHVVGEEFVARDEVWIGLDRNLCEILACIKDVLDLR